MPRTYQEGQPQADPPGARLRQEDVAHLMKATGARWTPNTVAQIETVVEGLAGRGLAVAGCSRPQAGDVARLR